MANLVENNLIITGAEAIEIIEKLNEEGMSYWRPRPKYMTESFLTKAFEPDGAFPLWYQWSLDNWGTKWDIYKDGKEVTIHGPEVAELYFTTANNTIAPFCNAMSEMYPHLIIELYSREEFEEEFTKLEWRNDD